MKNETSVILPLTKRQPHETVHEQVYQQLRHAIMTGRFIPGRSVTLRGLAKMLGVSLTPVREAIRRLVAERALEMLGNRRVIVPEMSPAKFEEAWSARLALEPRAAVKALSGIDRERLDILRAINAKNDAALEMGDVEGYVLSNQQFHFTLYRSAPSEVFVPLIASLWLQFGPFMRMIVGRLGTSQLVDQHKEALKAIEEQDSDALYKAIEADIFDGMRIISNEVLHAGSSSSDSKLGPIRSAEMVARGVAR